MHVNGAFRMEWHDVKRGARRVVCAQPLFLRIWRGGFVLVADGVAIACSRGRNHFMRQVSRNVGVDRSMIPGSVVVNNDVRTSVADGEDILAYRHRRWRVEEGVFEGKAWRHGGFVEEDDGSREGIGKEKRV